MSKGHNGYNPGHIVWLKPFEGQPREKCQLIKYEGKNLWMGQIVNPGPGDDGLREFTEDQIEGFSEDR